MKRAPTCPPAVCPALAGSAITRPATPAAAPNPIVPRRAADPSAGLTTSTDHAAPFAIGEFPDRHIRHLDDHLRLDAVGTATDRADATFRIGA